MRGQDNACAAVHARQLFYCDRITQHIQTGAAVLLGVRQPHKAKLAHFLDGFRGEFIFFVHEESLWLDLGFRKRADLSAQLLMRVGGSEQHGGNLLNQYQFQIICILFINDKRILYWYHFDQMHFKQNL